MPISTPLVPQVVVLQPGLPDLLTEERTLINDIRQVVYEEIDARTVVGATPIRRSDGAIKYFTLTGTTTFSFPADDYPEGNDAGQASTITLFLRQDATGNRAVIWPSGVVLWEGGAQPALSQGGGRLDIITFISLDGGVTWIGLVAAKDVR